MEEMILRAIRRVKVVMISSNDDQLTVSLFMIKKRSNRFKPIVKDLNVRWTLQDIIVFKVLLTSFD
jgi:hypothetical protein